MSLLGALNSAVTGLKVNQLAVDVTSRNVANAGTEGYTRKISPRENMIVGSNGAGVRANATTRQVNFHLQERLRVEQSRFAKLDVQSDYLRQVDQMFGSADQEGSISYAINDLAIALGALVDTPENAGVRAAVISQADTIARQLNQMSGTIQNLRSQAEQSIAAAVDDVNDALKAIEDLNREIANRKTAGQSTADLEDRRDVHLATVAHNLDIRTIERSDGSLAVFTNGGYTLVSDKASRLEFDNRHLLSAEDLYSDTAEERGVGTLTLVSPGGTRADLLKSSPPREGKIAGLLDMRDNALVEAQNQLDELAHSLAVSLSDDVTDITAENYTFALPAPPADGDRLALTYQTSGGSRTVTAYFVEPPITASMADRVPDPDNTVFVDRTAADPAAALIAALGTLSPAVPTGATGVIESAAAGEVSVPAGSRNLIKGLSYHSLTTDSATGPALNLFRDGNPLVGAPKDYTAAVGDDTYVRRGYAARISVNTDLTNDNTRLVTYVQDDGTETALGDTTRASLLLDRLTTYTMTFSRDTALGGQSTAYKGTVLDMSRALTSYQGMQAAATKAQATDQATRTQLLEERFQSQSGVNVDDEMAQLIMLQSSYAACAKVVRTVDAMFESLLSLK
ncbi:flagellar hook-associated protein FlgK [Novispirillum sp. DQ9]|uniref:flagellar hook-associated protein FlgK n=1 Tax=Novispirillum sp. DQ9 TaxID=3398612 RepID=UPI003C7B4285